MTTPEQHANRPTTITIPYWVATRIRSAMHREANSNDGCRCDEHYHQSVTEPQTAYAHVAEQLDLAYAEQPEHDNTTDYQTQDATTRAQRAHNAIRHHERIRNRLSDIRTQALQDLSQTMTTTQISKLLGITRARTHQILYPNGKE